MGIVEQIVGFLGPWNWWLLGILLALVEVVAPGTFFIWFAVAAILVGTLALLVDLSWQAELLIFVLLSAVAVLAGRRTFGRRETRRQEPNLNDRTARQIGRLAVLDTPIVNGTGHIRLDDTIWRVEGPDLPAGRQVRIRGASDGRLQVEPV